MSSRRSSFLAALLIGACLLVLVFVLAWFLRERLRPPESASQQEVPAAESIRAPDDFELVPPLPP